MDFLTGKKTYIIGGLLFLQAGFQVLVGDISLAEFLAKLPEMLTGLGLMALRAGVK